MFSSGEIVTFVQVDANKLYFLSAQLPSVCTLPFTLTLCFILLFKFLGFSFMAGMGVFVLSMLANVGLSRCISRFQKAYMKR